MGEEIQFPQHVDTISYPFCHKDRRPKLRNLNQDDEPHAAATDAYVQFLDKNE